MNNRYTPWGTIWGRLIAVFIIAAVVFGAVAAAVCFALWEKQVVEIKDLTVVSANAKLEKDYAKTTLQLRTIDGRKISDYDTRVEEDRVYLTLYSSIRGKYAADKSGAVSITVKTEKTINYIYMDDGNKTKELTKVIWSEPCSVKSLSCTESKLVDQTVNVKVKLSDSKRHICSFTSRIDGDKVYLSVNSAPIMDEYRRNKDGSYTLPVQVNKNIKSVWAEDGTESKKLCDIHWPEVLNNGGASFEEPKVVFENTMAFVTLRFKLADENRHYWSFEQKETNDGILYLTIYNNKVSNGIKKDSEGFYNIDFDIINTTKEIRIAYADGTEESLGAINWPEVVTLDKITLGEVKLEGEGDDERLVIPVKLPEGLHVFGRIVNTDGNISYIKLFATTAETDYSMDENGFYNVKLKLDEEADFVAVSDGATHQTVYCVDAKRLLGDESIKLENYEAKNGKLTMKIKVLKENFFLREVKSLDDAPRLMVSFLGSAVEGDLKPDADGIYTVELTLPEGVSTIIQEVPGNEKPLIENINA